MCNVINDIKTPFHENKPIIISGEKYMNEIG